MTERGQVTGHIGSLPAGPPVFDELTGREYLRYLAGLRELDTTVAEEHIEELLSQFSLLADADRRVDSYHVD